MTPPVREPPWRHAAHGLVLRVRLTPKGGRDAIDGVTATPDGPALAARVRAAPEDGAANAALEALVADWLDLAKRDVSLCAGHKTRTKLLAIAGSPVPIAARLVATLAKSAASPKEARS